MKGGNWIAQLIKGVTETKKVLSDSKKGLHPFDNKIDTVPESVKTVPNEYEKDLSNICGTIYAKYTSL